MESRRHRKATALMAGGLVAGIGAMTTLASWNDAEYASATLGAGVFNMQSSVNGTDYADHFGTLASPSAKLAFSAPVENLTSNDQIYAPLALRLSEGTDYEATATLQISGITGDIAAMLRYYSVYRTNTFGCASAADLSSATIILDGSVAETSTTFDLPKPATGSDGEPVNLCFVVLAKPNLPQGSTGAVTWEIRAESK